MLEGDLVCFPKKKDSAAVVGEFGMTEDLAFRCAGLLLCLKDTYFLLFMLCIVSFIVEINKQTTDRQIHVIQF